MRDRDGSAAAFRRTGLWALVLGVLTSCACAPWYRDDELRALHASDVEAMNAQLAQCDDHMSGGRATEAATCFEAALERNPREGRAIVGLARALVSAGRHGEARAVAEHGLSAPAGSQEPAVTRSLAEIMLASYAREELYAHVLDRAGEHAQPTVEQAATQYPTVFAKLAGARQAASGGDPRAALEKYAGWLADYGVPDHPLIRSWSDDVLRSCASVTASIVERGDREAAANNWVGAVVAYGQAFRYLPTDVFDAEVKQKLVEAAARVADPSWLSLTATDLAAQGDGLVADDKIGAALRAYRRAVATAPYWAAARHNLAVLFASTEMYREAAAQMDWFLRLAPSSADVARARTLRDHWMAKVPMDEPPSAGEPAP